MGCEGQGGTAVGLGEITVSGSMLNVKQKALETRR